MTEAGHRSRASRHLQPMHPRVQRPAANRPATCRGGAVQGCSSWRQASPDWRTFLVLLCACSKDGREQHADGFLRILGPCIVPQSRCCLPLQHAWGTRRAGRLYWVHRHGGRGNAGQLMRHVSSLVWACRMLLRGRVSAMPPGCQGYDAVCAHEPGAAGASQLQSAPACLSAQCAGGHQGGRFGMQLSSTGAGTCA